jgi:regulator of CtrA degradation
MVKDPSTDEEGEAVAASLVDFAGSELFMHTFEEGMAMVEETAAYLDGQGRQESRTLPREVALAYAGESMRLTTRLMQVASWLLVQRSVYDGEMAHKDAASEKYRLGSKDICLGDPIEGSDRLPAKLIDLLERSRSLYDRVDRLDHQLYRRSGAAPAPARVNDQLKKLELALTGAARED